MRRLGIEFEVSRADPVANHAKFATAHLFQAQPETDSFVSMVSTHVNRGRRNLAANTVLVMRHIGMSAFQTVLFPRVAGEEVKRLNHLQVAALGGAGLPVSEEIERALSVSQPLGSACGKRIHLVDDLLEVMLNLLRWNTEMATPEAEAVWKRRTVTYFVFDPRTRQFAPSKFCAFTAVPEVTGIEMAGKGADNARGVYQTSMTLTLYGQLDQSEPLFDGGRAQQHLTRGLAMIPQTPSDSHFPEGMFCFFHLTLFL